MAEWLKALLSKSSKGASSSWVRIPLSPPSYNFSILGGCCRAASPLGRRAFASGGGQLPLVEILLKESSDFVQKVPPICDFSVLRKVCLALASHGLGRKHAFSLIFVKKNQIYLLKDTI
jgi:hypothetical protein